MDHCSYYRKNGSSPDKEKLFYSRSQYKNLSEKPFEEQSVKIKDKKHLVNENPSVLEDPERDNSSTDSQEEVNDIWSNLADSKKSENRLPAKFRNLTEEQISQLGEEEALEYTIAKSKLNYYEESYNPIQEEHEKGTDNDRKLSNKVKSCNKSKNSIADERDEALDYSAKDSSKTNKAISTDIADNMLDDVMSNTNLLANDFEKALDDMVVENFIPLCSSMDDNVEEEEVTVRKPLSNGDGDSLKSLLSFEDVFVPDDGLATSEITVETQTNSSSDGINNNENSNNNDSITAKDLTNDQCSPTSDDVLKNNLEDDWDLERPANPRPPLSIVDPLTPPENDHVYEPPAVPCIPGSSKNCQTADLYDREVPEDSDVMHQYRLLGVISHVGQQSSVGHYYADVFR